MKGLIIYHSETGNTKRVAEFIQENTDYDIIELKPKKKYSKLGMMTSGIKRSLMQQNEELSIGGIDLSPYEIIILGTPVWAGHPTPVVNTAFEIMTGGAGKEAVAFSTFGRSEGESLHILRQKLEESGMQVRGTFGFSEKETEDEGKIREMIVKAGL